MDSSNHRMLRIDEGTISQILDRLDVEAGDSSSTNLRKSQRYPYRVRSVLACFPQGETVQSYTVACRNLSRDGIAFLIGQFFYSGTPCGVRLVSEYNRAIVATGRVVRCRYVPGTAGVHEVGVAFERPIDIEMFHRAAASVSILLLDDDLMQQHLLKQMLRKFSTEVTAVSNPDKAAETALATPFDLVLVNMETKSFDACDFIAQLRQAGYVRPVSALTTLSQTELDELSKCRGSCMACVPVALAPDSMASVVNTLQHEPVISSLAHDPEMAEIINQFVANMQAWTQQLQKASGADDKQEIIALARRLKMFAEGCGFEIIAEAAGAFEDACDTKASHRDCRDRLNTLIQLCLAARPASLMNGPAIATKPPPAVHGS